MSNPKCTIKDEGGGMKFGGEPHPYSWCIKPVEEMVDEDISPNPNGFKLTTEYIGGIFNYMDTLICNPEKGISTDCDGIIGNRYALLTNSVCREVDYNGKIINNNAKLYKYINNVSDGGNILTGGRPSVCKGILPSTLGAAVKINPIGIFTAIFGEAKPFCMKAKVKCHLVDKRAGGVSGGVSNKPNTVTLDIEDLKNMKADEFDSGSKPVIPSRDAIINKNPELREGFNNINSNILNSDILNNNNNLENDDVIVKMYYISLSLLLLLIIFKLLNKK